MSREGLERREEEWLAPYAAKSGRVRGRKYPEPEHPYRTAFQRDRDRVIHSAAFRRLEYKTQVFVTHEGDYFRTRLTHSMEAAQIARTIARALSLNEDLCEVLALSHDIGHTPFGHAGGDALEDCMKGHGGFEHNLQGVRVVELLERRYPAFPGLNLTWETRESMRKHTIKPAYPVPAEYEPNWAPLLECQVVDWADSIAYDAHDIDDGVKMGLIQECQLNELELWKEAAVDVARRYPGLDGELRDRQSVLWLINGEVTDLVEQTERNLKRLHIGLVEDVRKAGECLVDLSPEMGKKKRALQGFLHQNVYCHHRVMVMQEKAKRFVRALFEAYTSKPEQLPPHFQEWEKEVGVHRAVADYIAGMTDRYAQEEVRRMFYPFENVL